jgi:hypothetical protein
VKNKDKLGANYENFLCNKPYSVDGKCAQNEVFSLKKAGGSRCQVALLGGRYSLSSLQDCCFVWKFVLESLNIASARKLAFGAASLFLDFQGAGVGGAS